MWPVAIFKLHSSKQTYQINQSMEWMDEWKIAVTILTNIYLYFFFLLRERSTNKHGRRIAPPVNNYLEYLDVLLLQASFFFPFDGPYSSPPLCCAQLAGLSVVTTSPFNAPDRGLFAPIYVFSPITPWQAGGCQTTPLRCWWSPLWLVLPASCTIFFIFLDSIREEDSLICLSLVESVV